LGGREKCAPLMHLCLPDSIQRSFEIVLSRARMRGLRVAQQG